MIDAHHHIWRQTDLPWLLGPEQPRIFGSYRAASCATTRSKNILADIQDSLASINLSMCKPIGAPNWFVDEVAWVQSVADHCMAGLMALLAMPISPG